MTENMEQQNVFNNVFKDVDVGRDLTVGRDVTVEVNQIRTQTVFQQKTDFFEPSLERYKPSSNFPSPKITSQLLVRIKKQRLLVLAGDPDVDKDSLAKHTAYCLIEELGYGGSEIIAKEWYRSADPQSIDIELQNTDKTTVFILTQVTPQNIGYDLARIQKAAFSGQHYVVISTDITLAAWKQPDSTKTFWYKLSSKSVADSEQLISTLSEEDSLSQWYQQLEPRERLLALGLSFFDGLFDDQFFAALEEIVEKSWQKRDSSLRAFDYCDLDKLSNFFNFTETKNQGTKIAIRFPKQRQSLFKIAWNRDRRQILSALPVMVEIVRNSVEGQLANPELYDCKTKCKELRTAIAKTISDIGSISESSIQTTLLQLSASKHTAVQSTAAYAMARWRDPDYSLDQQLFNTINSWLDLDSIQARRIIEQINAILKDRNQKNSEIAKAEDYIKVTVALTFSYAALYDPPQEMSGSQGLAEELYDVLKQLGRENSPVVQKTFLNNTLPRVLPIHLRQLSQWLQDTIKQQVSSSHSKNSIVEFNKKVGKSLALAYRRQPKETVQILELWTEEALQNKPQYLDRSEITSRESLLATVIRTYGEIKCRQRDVLAPEDLFKRLHKILKQEQHSFVREAILFAIDRQARLYFDAIEPQLQSLVAEVTEYEREDIVRTLTHIYSEQRINLSVGDYLSSQKFMKIDNNSDPYKYQIWSNEQTPQTLMEEAMCGWMKNARNKDAQQIAIRSLFSFANNLLGEDEEQEEIVDNQLLSTETFLKDFYVEQIVPWLTIFLKLIQYYVLKRSYYKPFIREWSDYRQTITNILPEVLKQGSSSQSIKDLVFKRLIGCSDKKLEIIADILKLTIPIANNFSGFILCLVGFCLVGGVLLLILFF